MSPTSNHVQPPFGLTYELASRLQSWLPPGGSSDPGEWKEMYRATTHGFGGAVFHERCDGRARLLLLVRAREGDWLFGGFTAVGFIPGRARYIADPAAFLFSLTNSRNRPEKLDSKRTGKDLIYAPASSAIFGNSPSADLSISNNADTDAKSQTWTGNAYAASSSCGVHPMAMRLQRGWCAAEVVAWVV